ncbi:rolling circle replication-associated protein [Duganella aquatilis]|uniref:rolling circle replication-associated protein n=1 Tax=Duganella aquatilis TaxID=2666082 RepID=UPI001AA01FB2|nr:hypothetical protein [Duganella aquatilis]
MNELDYETALASIDFTSVARDGDAQKPDWWQGDRTRGAWQDTYTARKRVYPDGQCVVTVTKDKSFVGPAITRPRARRGESENREASEEVSARRAKQKVRDCCKAISADRMVTLTYRENMLDRDRAAKHFKAFCRRLGKVKKFHYVAVIEQQERGALHFHIAVRGRQCYALLRSIWQRVVGLGPDGQQMGQANVRDPHSFGFGVKGAHRLASYISKYCGKVMDCRDLNEKRYFRSRGIVLPELQYWRLPNCTCMLDAVHAAFRMIEGHAMENLDTWCNNALGVVYLATAPGMPCDLEYPF